MKTLIRFLLILVIAAAALSTAARYADGPFGLVAGGAFRTGTMLDETPDWRALADRATVELQLVEPPRSRTTWILLVDGDAYIPCAFMNTTWGRLWKRWPLEAAQDGRALLRIDDRIYERQLTRITQGEVVAAVVERLSDKYDVTASVPDVASGALWLFRLDARENPGLATR